jgi:hypothetical protein
VVAVPWFPTNGISCINWSVDIVTGPGLVGLGLVLAVPVVAMVATGVGKLGGKKAG